MKKLPTQVTCFDIDGKSYQVATSELSFRPAIYGVIIQDNKILLSKQWDGYDFPGGGVELGESNEAALVREVKEETGVDVRVGEIVSCHSSFFKLPFGGKFVHSIHMYYECQIIGGELSTKFFDDNEKKYADQPEWVELNKVPSLKIYSSIEATEILKKYL